MSDPKNQQKPRIMVAVRMQLLLDGEGGCWVTEGLPAVLRMIAQLSQSTRGS